MEDAPLSLSAQRVRALERANEIRLARSELKRELADGSVSAAEIILTPPCEASSWAIGDMLVAQRKWGATRSRRFLAKFHIPETKAIGALTERQRRMVAEALVTGRFPARFDSSVVAAPELPQSPPAWDELVAISRRQATLSEELAELTARRDELIRALSREGASRRSVAEAAAVTVGRVQQIVDKRPSSTPAGPVPAALGGRGGS